MNKTKISYLDFTWNITHGCSPISAGCEKCWARKMSKRLAGSKIRGYDELSPFKPYFDAKRLNEPSKIIKPSVIGVSFMGDLFHEDITEAQIYDVFSVMLREDHHTYILCTKRPERIIPFLDKFQYDNLTLDNIWFGCSIENQKTLKERSEPMLELHNNYNLNTWLSLEPLLQDISFPLSEIIQLGIADGFIVGGESGPGARYCDVKWIIKIANICIDNKTNFYLKQYGTHKESGRLGIIPTLELTKISKLPWKK